MCVQSKDPYSGTSAYFERIATAYVPPPVASANGRGAAAAATAAATTTTATATTQQQQNGNGGSSASGSAGEAAAMPASGVEGAQAGGAEGAAGGVGGQSPSEGRAEAAAAAAEGVGGEVTSPSAEAAPPEESGAPGQEGAATDPSSATAAAAAASSGPPPLPPKPAHFHGGGGGGGGGGVRRLPVTCVNLLRCSLKAPELVLSEHFHEARPDGASPRAPSHTSFIIPQSSSHHPHVHHASCPQGVRAARRKADGLDVHVVNFDWHYSLKTLGEIGAVEHFWATFRSAISDSGLALGVLVEGPPGEPSRLRTAEGGAGSAASPGMEGSGQQGHAQSGGGAGGGGGGGGSGGSASLALPLIHHSYSVGSAPVAANSIPLGLHPHHHSLGSSSSSTTATAAGGGGFTGGGSGNGGGASGAGVVFGSDSARDFGVASVYGSAMSLADGSAGGGAGPAMSAAGPPRLSGKPREGLRVERWQSTLIRYNCADSLDRTNLASFFGAIQVGAPPQTPFSSSLDNSHACTLRFFLAALA